MTTQIDIEGTRLGVSFVGEMVVLHDLEGAGDPASLRRVFKRAQELADEHPDAMVLVDAKGRDAMRLLKLYIKLGGELTHFVIQKRGRG